MPVMDEFREERDAIKNAGFGYKLRYFWDYYKWFVIGGIAGILIIFSFVKEILSNKDFAFYGFFLNCSGNEYEIQDYMDGFAEAAQLDTETYDVYLDSTMRLTMDSYDESTMGTVSKIMVSVTAGDIDFLSADPPVFEHYSSIDTFYDLREILTPAQINKYEPYFYYIDRSDIEGKRESLDQYVIKYTNHKNPSTMPDPIPVGLYIQECPGLYDIVYYKEKEALLGIPTTTTRLDTALQFIDYLYAGMEEE